MKALAGVRRMTRISMILGCFALCAGAVALAQGVTWSPRAHVPTGRFGPATAVINGNLYVVSGCCVTQFFPFTRFTVLEVYDPASNTWDTTKAPIPIGVYGPAGIGVLGGKLYLAGGQKDFGNIATLQIYDPTSNTWSTGASMPEASVGGASGVINGKLYVAGGMNAANTQAVATLRVYDPASNTWATKTSMSAARVFAGGAVFDGKLYAIGGQNGPAVAVVEAYDPATDTWTTKSPMPTARWGAATQTLGGLIYAAGGDTQATTLNTLEIYDPVANSWTTGDPLPTARTLAGSGVIDGTLYVVAGGARGAPGGATILLTVNEALESICCGVKVTVAPTAARRGQTVFVTASVHNASTAAETVTLEFSVTSPIVTKVGVVPLVIPANTNKSITVPFRIPESAPLGIYTLVLKTTDAGGRSVQTSTTLTLLGDAPPPGANFSGLWQGTVVVQEPSGTTTRQIQVDFTHSGTRLTGLVRDVGVTFDLNQTGSNPAVFQGVLFNPRDREGCQTKVGTLTGSSPTRLTGRFSSTASCSIPHTNDIDVTKVQ